MVARSSPIEGEAMDLAAMARDMMQAYNDRDVTAMPYADDVVVRFHVGAEHLHYHSKDEAVAHHQREWEGWPDANVTVHRVLADGEHVAVEGTWSATNTGPLWMDATTQLPATGGHIDLDMVIVSTVRDGKVVSVDNYWDDLGAFVALGFIPDPAAAPG
jgi:steroid delta-isomerase-like uncharacterized protein